MPANDTSVAGRIVEKIFNQDLISKGFNPNEHVQVYRVFVSKEQAEQIIATELADHDAKVRELIEAAIRLRNKYAACYSQDNFPRSIEDFDVALEALKK